MIPISARVLRQSANDLHGGRDDRAAVDQGARRDIQVRPAAGPLPNPADSLPAIAAFYLGATIHSAVCYWRGTGGMWKGRVQDGA